MLVLVGKSCSGKSTIQKELVKLGIKPALEYTTRPPRKDEIKNKGYHFVSERDFIDLKKKEFFAVTSSYKVFNGEIWRYGVAFQDLSDEKMLVTSPIGLKKLKEFTNICPVSFYINTDENFIWDRLIQRKDNIDEAQRRLISDRNDFLNIDDFVDYKIENNGIKEPRDLAKDIMRLYELHICHEKI